MKKFIENAVTGILLGGFTVVFIAVIYRTVRWIMGF